MITIILLLIIITKSFLLHIYTCTYSITILFLYLFVVHLDSEFIMNIPSLDDLWKYTDAEISQYMVISTRGNEVHVFIILSYNNYLYMYM